MEYNELQLLKSHKTKTTSIEKIKITSILRTLFSKLNFPSFSTHCIPVIEDHLLGFPNADLDIRILSYLKFKLRNIKTINLPEF